MILPCSIEIENAPRTSPLLSKGQYKHINDQVHLQIIHSSGIQIE